MSKCTRKVNDQESRDIFDNAILILSRKLGCNPSGIFREGVKRYIKVYGIAPNIPSAVNDCISQKVLVEEVSAKNLTRAREVHEVWIPTDGDNGYWKRSYLSR
jgi:hypothetical protein